VVSVVVVAIQLKPITDGTIMGILREKTVKRSLELIDEAATLESDIVCFPAFLPNVGKPEGDFTPTTVQDTNKTICAKAVEHGVFIIAGCISKVGEKFVVDELLINPSGEIEGSQRRIHLWADDERILIPGTEINVFETRFGKIGIAESIYVPEVCRILALKGADIIFHPSNIFVPEMRSWHTLAKARAIENIISIVAVNPARWRTKEDLTSGQKDTPQGGGSIILDVDLTYSIEKVPLPQVRVVSKADSEEKVLIGRLDLEKTKRARRYWLERRKPQLYETITRSTL